MRQIKLKTILKKSSETIELGGKPAKIHSILKPKRVTVNTEKKIPKKSSKRCVESNIEIFPTVQKSEGRTSSSEKTIQLHKGPKYMPPKLSVPISSSEKTIQLPKGPKYNRTLFMEAPKVSVP